MTFLHAVLVDGFELLLEGHERLMHTQLLQITSDRLLKRFVANFTRLPQQSIGSAHVAAAVVHADGPGAQCS